jgi:RNA-directed DNA polymerase
VQRLLLAGLLDRVPPHAAAQGFRRRHSVLTHAALHTGQAVVVRVDLADFFTSVGRAQVQAIFSAAGYRGPVARMLAALCTTATPASVIAALPGPEQAADVPGAFRQRQWLRRPHLPQGAPTSPALANLCAYRLDVRLAALAGVFGAQYSRYADDLTFSGGADLARIADRLVDWVTLVARDSGFAVQHRKTRVMKAAARQQVTGIVVNERLNLRRRDLDVLRAILTNCVRDGPAKQNRAQHPDVRAWLQGRVAWVAAVHPERGARLRAVFERIVWQPVGDVEGGDGVRGE